MERVFGVISPKIRRKTVTTKVASPTPFSPKKRIARAVIIEERSIFTKSFATRRVLINNSFFSRSFPARTALLSFLFFKILNRSLLIPRKELSEIEKSVDKRSRITERESNPARYNLFTLLLKIIFRFRGLCLQHFCHQPSQKDSSSGFLHTGFQEPHQLQTEG